MGLTSSVHSFNHLLGLLDPSASPCHPFKKSAPPPPHPITAFFCNWRGTDYYPKHQPGEAAPPKQSKKHIKRQTACEDRWCRVACNMTFARKVTGDSLTALPDSLLLAHGSPWDLCKCFHKCFHNQQSWCLNVSASASPSKHSSAFKALLKTRRASEAHHAEVMHLPLIYPGKTQGG